MTSEPDSSKRSAAVPMALSLAAASAVGYLLVWSLLEGVDGCGPPGHSTSGRIFSAAPLVFPVVAALVVLAVGAKLDWHPRRILTSALMTVLVGGALELVVFVAEFGAHHCGE